MSSGILSVYEPCQLTTTGASANPGDLAYVISTQSYYRYEESSTPLAPNADFTVVSTYNGPAQPGCPASPYVATNHGRWLLLNGPYAVVSSSDAESATDWYIDPVNGVDTNDGITALTPLQTFKQLALRWQAFKAPAAFDITVHVADGSVEVVAGDTLSFVRPMVAGYKVTLEGALINVTSPATDLHIATYTAAWPTSNHDANITDGGLFSYVPFVGKFIVLSDGSSSPGAYAMILRGDGDGAAYVTPFLDAVGNLVTPVPGANEKFQIFDAFAIRNGDSGAFPYADLGVGGKFYMTKCKYDNGGGFAPVATQGSPGTWFQMSQCLFEDTSTISFGEAAQVRFTGCWVSMDDLNVRSFDGLYINASFIRDLAGNYNGDVNISQGTAIHQSSGLFVRASGVAYMGTFSIDGVAGPAVTFDINAKVAFLGVVYGSGVGVPQFYFNTYDQAIYRTAAALDTFRATSAPAVGAFAFGSVTKDIGDLPFVNNATAAQNQAALISGTV